MRIIIWIISLIAIGYAGYVVWQPLELDVDKIEKEKSVGKPLVMKKARFNDFENDQKSWLLLAEVAKIFHEEEITLLYTVDGELYDENDPEKVTRVKAQQGNINGKNQVISLKGNVQFYFDNGDTILTNELIMDQRKKVIYNNEKIHFQHIKDQIDADSVRYEMNTEKLYLKNPVIQLVTL